MITPVFTKALILVEIEGAIVGSHPLDRVVLTIGRMPNNDITIPCQSPFVQQVSRFHAKIVWKNNSWVIEDGDSLNKLHVKQQQVSEHTLRDGDRVYLAPKVALLYREEPDMVAEEHISTQLPEASISIEIDQRTVLQRPLNKRTLRLGSPRGTNNDLMIASPYISAHHAQIIGEQNTWIIKDCQSKNGLRLNGQRIKQHCLANGERIYLAHNVSLSYHVVS